MMHRVSARIMFACLAAMCFMMSPTIISAQTYLDNQTDYSNQDQNTETRRSEHFRVVFGHYDRDGANAMSEQFAQGNLQMFERMWNRWVNELGMHDINESVTNPDGNKYKANFNFLMTWNDGGGGGSWSSMDGNGFFYAMSNPVNCRFDPPSGATPHEFGHVWEGSTGGFNGTDSSGAWWECTANWMQLQFLNSYPQAGGYLYNSVFYPAHGRDYYDSWMIWETAREDPRYGAAWVNRIWTDYNADQQAHEYIIDRMIRCDQSGSADKAGGLKDLWGDMAKKMVTWDYERQRWFAQSNTPWNGDTWEWYTRCRAPMVKMPGATGVYRPAREHIPQEFGFHYIPLTVTPGTTVSCNFQPLCDPIRQSDWRACLVAVSNNGDARYSNLWNTGTNSITLSSDEDELYLSVIAVPKPMKIAEPVWAAYTADYGVQFPYTVSFTNASPTNVIYPVQSHTNMHQHANGGGWVSNTATVDASAYVGPNAQVLDSAQVRGNARIEEYGVVKNNAQVRDNAVVSGHGLVSENAQVYGNAKVRDWAIVFGYTELYENAKAIEHAGCGGGSLSSHNKVYGNAVLKGVTSVYATSTFSGSLITDGDTANGGVGDHGVHFGWQWGQNPSIFTNLVNNNYQYSGLTFENGVTPFAKDQYGINHGYMMNGCRPAIDSGGTPRGGWVLPLNGTNQYVELHNSANDFKDMSIAVWVKWTGTANDQIIWSMGDGANKQMFLTPKNSSTSKVRFSISDGTTTQFIDGAAALGAGWTHVVVTFTGNTGTLYVNGAQVGQNTSMTLDPDALNAPLMENANYLGRGNAGNYFQGSLDDFRVYNKTLTGGEVTTLYNTAAPAPVTPTTDTTAPTPNAATWLANPVAISDNAITMSATVGTDASNWVEYYFDCTSGAGHDSGWVSFNKYTDVGLAPGTAYAYTVKMRDRNGNETAASSALSATTQTSSAGTASFAYGPVGISSSAITMRATKLSNASGLVEYKFTRNDGVTSGWQASPKWTNTGLSADSSYTYTVQVRDGRGHTSAVSAAVAATARDMAAPLLPIPAAYWTMMPYATIDNKVSMTAMDASDPNGVQYYFHCTSGNGPDSQWQDSPTFVTPALPDGTYTYQYKLRDKSSQYNESGYSTTYNAVITPTTGYHDCSFAQLATLPDDYLVVFNGVVLQANTDNYLIKDTATNSTITVRTAAYGQATDPANILKIVKVKGHLYTFGGTRVVTYATVTSLLDPPMFAISGRVTGTGGAGVAGATVYFSTSPNASQNPTCTTTTDVNGYYSKPVVNSQWYVRVSAPGFFASSDQTATVNGAAVPNVNFSLVAAWTITASAGSGGTITPSGSLLVNGGDNKSYTIAPNAGYSIASVLVDGTNIGSVTSYTFSNVDANHTISATFAANTRSIPQTGNLIASAVTDTLPASGNTGNWASYLPAGQTYAAMSTPTVSVINGAKWAHMVYADNDGYNCGSYSSPIACNGASIVVAVKPSRNGINTSWTSCVDVFYNRMVLGVRNDTGKVLVHRNGTIMTSDTAIPDGQATILSLVVQPDGKYKVWANGSLMMDITTTSDMTQLVPGVAGSYANNITIGRNWPDGWPAFNGDIGDTFIYKVALSDAERQQLEADLTAKFLSSSAYTITASAGTGGTISPSGTVNVGNGGSASFVITPTMGYAVSQVAVDGVNQGAITSYTFSNVTANHTIAATFSAVPTYTITASAGTGGTISPSGAVVVNSGSSKTFTITPSAGHSITNVTVDGSNQGAISSYTFNNITGNHTISATFTAQALTITASAAAGGTISPSGATSVNYGSDKTFTITPNAGYAISSVMVDGVDVGPVTSYTFGAVIANHTISAIFIGGTRSIPAADQLIFGIDTKDLPASGAISSWPRLWPAGSALTTMGSPTALTVGSTKWEHNLYPDSDGFRAGQYTTPIACNGASIVMAVKPIRSSDSGNWRSLVDVFYDRLVLGIANNTGQICVRRNGQHTWAPAGKEIPNGQATILSLVAQPTGTYNVYANGVLIMNNSSTSDLTSLVPLIAGGFADSINVGRNQPDGWTTFNGDIGDVFLYKTALTNDQRARLEADLTSKFIGTTYSITASAGVGGSISPSGTVSVNHGGSQTFTITPNANYAIADVQIDGISVGVAASYTFNNVTSDHTISATFLTTGYAITASAGSNGTITPAGTTYVATGGSQIYTITPNAGYNVSNVVVDGVSQGAITSYTFTNVTANHTISATFSIKTYAITASAGTGGTINPSGTVAVNHGASQIFTITPSTGYAVANVTVDGASVGAVTTYTFNNVTAAHTISATFSANTYTINASAGANGSISPDGAVAVVHGANQMFTITPDTGYVVSDVTVDGTSVGAVTSYTFSNVTANHTIAATFDVDGYTLTATAGSGGTISPNGTTTVNAGANQTYTITANTGYVIADVTVDGVSQGAIGTYTFTNVQANHTIAATFSPLGRNVPVPDQLLFSAVTESFPASGSTGNWATYLPSGGTLTTTGTPMVETIGGVKWEQNSRVDMDGYRLGRYASPIAVNGATFVVAVKPVRNGYSDAWTSIIDIFYDRLVLGIRNDTGIVCVKRNINTSNVTTNSTVAIPDGEMTVLSLVVQADGSYKVYANGTEIMNQAGTGANLTSLDPDHTPVWGNDPDFTHYINVGRNDPDGWSTFNGNIGDVFVYKTALSDADRQILEDDIRSKFGIQPCTITASAGTGGTISPSGATVINAGLSQSYTITPNAGYMIDDVTVDGVSQGAITSYTFANVTADHTIAATFVANIYTITASAGANGSISPAGAVPVVYGASQMFTITPDAGYAVYNVTVDGTSVGAVTSYTFSNVTADHTISATFAASTPTPVAFYRFENNVLDSQGAYNGTAYNTPTYVAGRVGSYAIQFNGSNEYVAINRPVSTNWTISFFVKTTQTSRTGTQWYAGNGLVDGEVSGTRHDFGISYLNSKVAFGVGNVDTTIQSTSNINTGNWVHVTCTRNSTTGQMKIYINGVLETTGTGPTGSKTAASTLNIGRLRTAKNYFNGAIDQLKIFNSVLTDAQIAALAGETGIMSVRAAADNPVPPLVDLSPASLEPGVLSEWKNAGTAGGTFISDGTTPVVETIDGVKAVTFAGSDWMTASFTAPASITGNSAFTTSVWAYNPQINVDETILSWATDAQMKAGSMPAGGWHLINVSYDKTNLNLYVDGVLMSSERRSLNTTPGMPVILGAAYTTESSTYYPTLNFTGSIGSVKVFDRALSQKEIVNIFKTGF